MAKIAFTKLGLKINQDIKTIEYNGQNIEIKQYLSVNNKLKLASEVINNSVDDNNYANPVQVDVYTGIGIIDYYTNISLTEKQREDTAKLYDLIYSSGLLERIISTIPEAEYEDLTYTIHQSIEAVYTYRNSMMGILDAVSTDYKDLNLDATEISDKLSDENNMTFLKDVLTKLG